MPPKQHTHSRTWGSRYDTLPTSPAVSPDARKDEVRAPAQDVDESSNGQDKRKDDKLPHDASIFVGSLPSNVNHTELTRLLTEHLAGYTEIKSIKVIRDSKGGVCAFVQCEDAASASSFLKNLQSSPPKPLLGRILRYEPARAFRTLLVSYRAPSQIITPDGICSFPPGPVAGQVLELELPHAMRLWKPKNGKYHRVIYNAEAIEADDDTRAQCKDDVVAGKEEVVYLQPLKFDEESIIRIAKYFGPLERVSKLGENHELVQPPANNGFSPECFPSPHNAPRSNCMDASCWEVKWVHRDDCVTALMALRRIPHLSVSWAHQPQNITVEQCSSFRRHQHAPNYVSRVQSRVDRFQPYTSFAPPLVTALNPPGDPSNSQAFLPKSMFENDSRIILKHGPVFSMESDKSWVNPVTPPTRDSLQISTSDISSEVSPDGISNGFVTTRIDWAEADFPPLVESEFDTKIDWSAWGRPRHIEVGSRQPPVVTSHSAGEIIALRRIRVPSPLIQDDEVPTPGLAMSPATPRTTLPQTPVTPTYGVHLPACDTGDTDRVRSDRPSPVVGEFDPTTLFVGGLEMYGPMAWTDEKVRALFSRFEGLEHIRVVRPANGNAAFAFVKYNNIESPARAILEEHNRVYAGRALKVQLRDTNPPRSPWKQIRGRGRFNHPPRKVVAPQRTGGDMHRPAFAPPVQSGLGTTVGAYKTPPTENILIGEAMDNAQFKAMHQEQSEDTVTHTPENVQTQKYREWYDAPVAVPPESGTGSTPPVAPPPATAGLPYPVPGYYPVPWMHPYPQPGHYQVPYYPPYPGYPMSAAPVQAYATTPPSSETNGPVAGNNHPWPGVMCNAYTPYFGPPGVEQQGAPGQAPLVPSGFIQNDQGTLIAVYPPDALDQYMASQGANTNGGGNPPVSTQSGNTAPVWPSVQALPGSGSSYSIGSQTASNPPKLYQIPSNPLWSTMAPPCVPMSSINHPALAYSANAGSRGGENLGTTSPSPVLARRQGSRRDFHNHSSSRSFRVFNNRNGRGHMHHHGFAGNPGGSTSLNYRNSKAINTPDWNQWSTRQ